MEYKGSCSQGCTYRFAGRTRGPLVWDCISATSNRTDVTVSRCRVQRLVFMRVRVCERACEGACVCGVVDVGTAVLDSVCSAASLVLQEVTTIGCSSKFVSMRSSVSAQESGHFSEPAERTRQQVTRQRRKEEQRQHDSRMRAVGRPTHQSGAPLSALALNGFAHIPLAE